MSAALAMDFRTGNGLSNQEFIDLLTERFSDPKKSYLEAFEVMPILHMAADIRERLDPFVYYIANHIGSLRGEYEPSVFERVTKKVVKMIVDRRENPKLFEF